MARHIESWYEYVKVTLGYKANNGDIRLVTGCDKACSWGMAVAEQGPIFPHTYKLQFREAANKSSQVKHMWECNNGIVETRTGPHQEEVRPLLSGICESDIAWPPILNQCLFVESLNNRLSTESWARICAKNEELYNDIGSSSTDPSLVPRAPDQHAYNSPSNGASDTPKGKGVAKGSQNSHNDSQSDFVSTNQTGQALYTVRSSTVSLWNAPYNCNFNPTGPPPSRFFLQNYALFVSTSTSGHPQRPHLVCHTQRYTGTLFISPVSSRFEFSC